MEPAAECLARQDADVLLLAIGRTNGGGGARSFMRCIAAPRGAYGNLSESENESLAIGVASTRAQDFLAKERLDRACSLRSLRYASSAHRLQKTLHSLSLIDDLTGLHNRADSVACRATVALDLRKGSALLVYMDPDDLKLINDTHGHMEGNRALIRPQTSCARHFRQSDILARLGGKNLRSDDRSV